MRRKAVGAKALLPGRWLFVLFCLGLAALFIPIPRMGIPVSLENVIYAAGLVLLLRGWKSTKKRISGRPLLLAIVVTAFMVIQYYARLTAGEDSSLAVSLLRRGMLVLMGAASLRSWRRVRIATIVVVVSVLFSASIGVLTVMDNPLAKRISQIHTELMAEQADDENLNLDKKLQMDSSRVVGLRGSAFAFSYLTAAGILLLIGLAMDSWKHQRKKLFWMANSGILVMFLAVILNAERSSVLCLGVGLLFLLWRGRSAILGAILCILIGAGYMLIKSNDQLLKFQDSDRHNLIIRMQTGEGNNDRARLGYAIGGILTVIENPLTGGSNVDYQRNLHRIPLIADNIMWGYGNLPPSHNTYVNAGQRAGVMGWIFMGVLLWILFHTGREAVLWHVPREMQNTMRALWAALAAVLVNAFFHNQGILSAEPMTWALMALCLGGAVLDRRMHCLFAKRAGAVCRNAAGPALKRYKHPERSLCTSR